MLKIINEESYNKLKLIRGSDISLGSGSSFIKNKYKLNCLNITACSNLNQISHVNLFLPCIVIFSKITYLNTYVSYHVKQKLLIF